MTSATQVDVLIVGAGLSGVGAAYRLQTQSPGRSYAILESRDTIGGTWDLFRYPGIRSDSDMFTLGYPFRPWKDAKAIADGPSILSYIRETAAEYGIDRKIRFGHRVVRASWSSVDSKWTVEAETGPGGRPVTFTCSFLYLCSGYYSYETGHAVDFPGRDEFRGQIVHPQHWPADLDYRGKRVVVVGSGATAVTLVPKLAEEAEHVTMLQRSPSYIVARPGSDRLADRLRALLPEGLAHRVIRGKNVLLSTLTFQFFRRWPERAARLIRTGAAKQLQGSVAVDPHFMPSYKPWDQRLCLVPEGDLFKALRNGRAGVVTDRIDTFTAAGLRLASGAELAADVVITATGLKMVSFGQIALTVDGRAVDPTESVVYKGMMFSGIPNLAWCVGYTNNSWTLRADLTSQYVCRLLNHMSRQGYTSCVPEVDATEAAKRDRRPILDLSSGYVRRAADVLPKQGDRQPWRMRQNYLLDLAAMRLGRVDGETMRFGRGKAASIDHQELVP
ncbi:flavin-containing monooxygenase [Amycolatopsis nigrescens]|uniref:flavin-containing monooxygenase n=1 Tax=Amycolatopsis nigrescens TaxID=381445 RepID=UPI0003A459E5|nr:NAD(P)/FAD-dependent oxidoreductase [Amycolatopsis nigrescens]